MSIFDWNCENKVGACLVPVWSNKESADKAEKTYVIIFIPIHKLVFVCLIRSKSTKVQD